MKKQGLVKIAAGGVLALSVIALGGWLSTPSSVQAQDHRHDDEASLVRIGFEIAPVPLNLQGKDPWKVGYGSFLVNAVGDCNGCHTGGGPPNFNYAAGATLTLGSRRKPIRPLIWKAGRILVQLCLRCRGAIHRPLTGWPRDHTLVRT